MSRDLQLSRPKLKSLRSEALLRGAECRATRQIATLSNYHDFPTDPHDVPIILRTVFKLLADEPFPVKPASRYSPAAQDVKQALHCVFGWYDILAISIRKLGREARPLLEIALDLHEQNIYVLLRWMKYYLREQSWIFEFSDYYQHREDTAPRLVAEALNNLNQSSNRHPLLQTMQDSEEVVDLLFSIWMWQDKDGNALYLKYPPSQTMGKAIICPIIRLFSTFCIHNNPFLVWEKMCTLSGREHARFIRCSVSRIEQWRPPPRDSDLLSQSTMPINGLETLLMALTALHFVPQSARAFVKGNVVGNAIRQARLYGSDLPSIGSSSASFSTKLTYSLFYTKGCSGVADLKNRVICQVLEAESLNVILDYIFAAHAKNPSFRLVNDTSDASEVTDKNPVAYLAPFCVYRRVCEATLAAIKAIPESRMEVLETGWAAEYWKPFSTTVRLYEHIWGRVPTNRINLCDNLQHHRSMCPDNALTAKECSHCRAFVYCSSKCQQEDWENHGGKECRTMRRYRVDRELRSAWLSHRTRTFFLYLIQQFLLNLEVGLPLDAISGTLSDDGSTLTYKLAETTTPTSSWRSTGSSDTSDLSSKVNHHLIKFDTTQVKCRAFPQPVNDQNRVKLKAELEKCLISDPDTRIPRFNELLLEPLEAAIMAGQRAGSGTAEVEQSRPILATNETSLGNFRITVFGRYLVENDREGARVILRNGYLRVEPGQEFNEMF